MISGLKANFDREVHIAGNAITCSWLKFDVLQTLFDIINQLRVVAAMHGNVTNKARAIYLGVTFKSRLSPNT